MAAALIDPHRLQGALAKARQALLDVRNQAGHWEGELSSSALSTATAVCALTIVEKFRVRSSEFGVSSEGGAHSAITRGLA